MNTIVGVDFQPLGDSGVRMQFQRPVSPELNKIIRTFCRRLKKEKIDGVIEWVPTYDAVTVYYRPDEVTYDRACQVLANRLKEDFQVEKECSETVFIPVLYGGDVGEDLPKVGKINGLTKQEVIDIHTGTDYLIYMMGFLPGFPYLGGMSKSIATPRLDNPRNRVPAGAVGIAGVQTGIYPLESPGGWNLIGQTPVKLFDRNREQPFLYQAGDRIRFVPIDKEEYESIRVEVDGNRYGVKKEAAG